MNPKNINPHLEFYIFEQNSQIEILFSQWKEKKELFISINIEPSLINEGFVVYNKIFISTLTPTPLPSRERGKTHVCFTVLSNQGRGVKHMFVLPFIQIKGEWGLLIFLIQHTHNPLPIDERGITT